MNTTNYAEAHETLLVFLRFLTRLQRTKRSMFVTGDKEWREETVIGHVELVTYVAEFVNILLQLGLDTRKVFDLLRVHDFPEGPGEEERDVCTLLCSPELAARKHEVELAAMQKICLMFPQIAYYEALYTEYRRCESPEARFIHALEVVVSALCLILDEGRTCKHHKITLGRWMKDRGNRVDLFEPLGRYAREIIYPYFVRHERKLFHFEE